MFTLWHGKPDKDFYKLHNHSNIYMGNEDYLPVCKDCVKILYEQYKIQYKKQFAILDKATETTEETNRNNKNDIEKLAIRRLCMAFDIYYSDSLFESALRNQEKFPNLDLPSAYFKMTNLKQNCRKSYDTTILEEGVSQELLRASIADKAMKQFGDDGLHRDIYNLCLKLMKSLRGKYGIDAMSHNIND